MEEEKEIMMISSSYFIFYKTFRSSKISNTDMVCPQGTGKRGVKVGREGIKGKRRSIDPPPNCVTA